LINKIKFITETAVAKTPSTGNTVYWSIEEFKKKNPRSRKKKHRLKTPMECWVLRSEIKLNRTRGVNCPEKLVKTTRIELNVKAFNVSTPESSVLYIVWVKE
jgi:hypothetical protein